MGAKFYRGADKPKKIRKRLTQTRSWFRTLKWVACRCPSPSPSPFRPRAPHDGGGPPLQGLLGPLHWAGPAPRPQAVRPDYRSVLQAHHARQDPI